MTVLTPVLKENNVLVLQDVAVSGCLEYRYLTQYILTTDEAYYWYQLAYAKNC